MSYEPKHFRREEFACKCGCAVNGVHDHVLRACDMIRDALGQPVVINSGYRCEVHNTAIGGARNSLHMQGRAADMQCQRAWYAPLVRCILAFVVTSPWLGGIGIYPADRFVHIDLGPRRTWIEIDGEEVVVS